MPPKIRPDVAALPTVTIHDVELCAVGTWNGRAYTAAEFDEAASNWRELRGTYDVPVKLGHTDDQSLTGSDAEPAIGWVSNVRRVGNSLVADLLKVPEKLARLIKSGAYPKRSCEFLLDATVGGKQRGFMLSALSLLGSVIPAAEGLEDIVSLYNRRGEADGGTTVRLSYTAKREAAMRPTRKRRLASGPSTDDIQSAVEDALAQQYPPAESDEDGQGADGPSCNVLDWFLHGDQMSVIVSDQDVDNLFEIPFEYDAASDTATLGSPTPVKGTYTPNQGGQESGGDGDGDEGAAGGDGADAQPAKPGEAAEQQMSRWPNDATHQLARGLVRGQVARLKSGDSTDGVNKAIAALDALLESTEPAVSGGRGAPDWRAAVRMAKRALAAVRLRGGGRDQPGGPAGEAKPAAATNSRRQEGETMTDAELRKLLGLAEDADLKAEVVKLKATHVNLSDHRQTVDRLETLEKREADREAEIAIEGAIRAAKLAPAQREWAKALCLSDRKAFDTYVETARPVVDLHEHGRAGEGLKGDAPSPTALQLAREAGISVEKLNDTRTLAEKLAAQRGESQFRPEYRPPTLRRFLTADNPGELVTATSTVK